MKTNQNVAKTEQDEASNACPSCGRHGLRVFLLRQAVISKNKTDTDPVGDVIYQELGDYAKRLSFTGRIPDEELQEYHYILRTIRDGYIYVIQQKDDDIESRILQAYEVIEGSLRRKATHNITGSKPRTLAKACQYLYHSIPSMFLHLDEQNYTKAWIAYSPRPWSKSTISDYLLEQNTTALSRFTQVDLTTFEQNQTKATNNRSVPFDEVFGYPFLNPAYSSPSKVLEFRFADGDLPNFNSVVPFASRLTQREIYGNYVQDLYRIPNQAKHKSAAIVLEDTLAIAEELNAQRASKLQFYNDKPSEEIELIDDNIDIGFDVKKQEKIYEARAKKMLAMVNPDLQRRFQYYQEPMFKKRFILELIQNYRFSLENSYDTKLNQLKERQAQENQQKLEQQKLQQDYFSKKQDGTNESTDSKINVTNNYYDSHKEILEYSILLSEKNQKLHDFDSRLKKDKIASFKSELESAYNEVLKYYKRYSDDYFIYVRWLFGETDFVSKYAKITPKSFNNVKFWQREFDFTTEQSKINHVKDISNILLDITTNEVHLEEDNALWDELLSNPSSIYYVLAYANGNGIPLDEKSFNEIDSDVQINWNDLMVKTTNFATVYNQQQEQKSEKNLTEKEQILTAHKIQMQSEVNEKQAKLTQIERDIADLKDKQGENKAEYTKLKESKKALRNQLAKLDQQLKNIQQNISSLASPSEGMNLLKTNSATSYLFEQAVKKETNLLTRGEHQPINLKVHRLHVMDELAKHQVYSAEINIKVRTKSIETVFAMLAEMHGDFFRQNGFTIQEQAFLQQFQVEEKPVALNTKQPATKMCKLYISLPDKDAMTLFIKFIKGKEILSVNDLKKLIKNELAVYTNLTLQKNIINSQRLAQQASMVDNAKQLDNANLKKGEIPRQQAIASGIVTEVEQSAAQITKVNDKIAVEQKIKNIRTTGKSYQLNLKVNALVGLLTMWSINDNLQMWGKPQPGDGEVANQRALLTNLSTLALLSVDLVSQYRHIKLQMQSLKAIRAGTSTTLLESKLALNTMLGRGVAFVFAGMTIVDALTELKSAFSMLGMEDSRYFYARVGGAFAMGIGAVLLLIMNPLFLAFGVILLIVGAVLIAFSKKYDNFSALDHWLNRCYFGQQEELDYLEYNAYNEHQSLTGFGQAVNDYLIMANGIDTFVSFKPLLEYFNAPDHRRNVQLYLNIPNFALTNPSEYIKVKIRLFDCDYHRGTSQFIDFEYRISTTGITRQPTFMVISRMGEQYTQGTDYIIGPALADNIADKSQTTPTGNVVCADWPVPIEKPEPIEQKFLTKTNLLIENPVSQATFYGQPIQHIDGLMIPSSDVRQQGEFSFSLNKLANSELISSSELIVKKHLAGTWNYLRIKQYQLVAYYYNRDELPLVIIKNSKNIAED